MLHWTIFHFMFSQKGSSQALFLIINYIFPKQNYNVLSGNYDIENTVQDAAIPIYHHRKRHFPNGIMKLRSIEDSYFQIRT
jgi:hypothetical protein